MRFRAIYGKKRPMNFLVKTLGILVFLITPVMADILDTAVSAARTSIEDDYPEPPNPEPGKDTKPVDDTKLFLLPGEVFHTAAPQLSMRGGYKHHGKTITHGGGVAIGLLLEAGRLGFVSDVGVSAGKGEDGAVLATDGDIKLRFRYPLGKRHVVWWGAGADVGWHQSTADIEDYTRAGGTIILGVMRPIERNGQVQCVIHLFGKASIYAFNSMNTKSYKTNWSALRPAIGGEGFAQCGTVRFAADYEHLLGSKTWFNVLDGIAGDVDRFSAQISKTWLLPRTNLQLGVYGKAEMTYEHGLDNGSADPSASSRGVPGIFGGLEVRY